MKEHLGCAISVAIVILIILKVAGAITLPWELILILPIIGFVFMGIMMLVAVFGSAFHPKSPPTRPVTEEDFFFKSCGRNAYLISIHPNYRLPVVELEDKDDNLSYRRRHRFWLKENNPANEYWEVYAYSQEEALRIFKEEGWRVA
jgi:hypothetical protein